MDRKEIVKILGEHLGIKPKYLGVPSFAYEVGDFTVTREGKILNKAGDEVELEEILSPAEEIAEEESPTDDITAIEISFPLEGHDERTIKNLLNMIYSKQVLIKKVFELEENIVEEDLIKKVNEVEALEDILEIIDGENCKGIDFDEEKITFTFISEEIEASAEFLSLLIKKAKELKYASAKPIETDNEKYTFRTWLIRLGMVGSEYKTHRKILLSKLTGSSAFRNGIPANEEDK